MGEDGVEVEGDGFYLPPEFFTDDDFITEKETFKRNNSLCFPSHHGRRFFGGSSPKLVEGPIYLAAGQVSKLKLVGGDNFLGPRGCSPHISPSVFQNTNIQGRGMGLEEMVQAAWAIQQNPTHIGSGMYIGGVAVKRKCAGTGVFLPRRYGSNDDVDRNAHYSNSRKKTEDTAAAIRALTKKFDSLNCFPPSQSVSQSRLNNALIQEYEMLVARRHAMMLQHHRNLLLLEQSPTISRDMYLP